MNLLYGCLTFFFNHLISISSGQSFSSGNYFLIYFFIHKYVIVSFQNSSYHQNAFECTYHCTEQWRNRPFGPFNPCRSSRSIQIHSCLSLPKSVSILLPPILVQPSPTTTATPSGSVFHSLPTTLDKDVSSQSYLDFLKTVCIIVSDMVCTSGNILSGSILSKPVLYQLTSSAFLSQQKGQFA